ncbi:glycosyltransferase family 4 protein [Pararobbsia alpina]|uniref:D-inositol-3-phosphate glycosyltransferase n=1 Tax=Pararobbsia alpina TaxID=621374 RepID=A0A6S7B4Y8_9BURK|nr:glycosyltransferase family 4 protein [Pararobbsia alpina]CAB3778352.1 D-inositol-3-phosphate glycosyltransferase [Pararobbsia alpina]
MPITMTRARILFVDQSGELGGGELALLPVAVRHRERSAVVLLQDGPFREKLEAAGVTVHLLADARVSSVRKTGAVILALRASFPVLRQIRALARLARGYDLIYLNTQKAFVLGTLAKLFVRRPVVWFLHDILSRDHFGPFQLHVVRMLTPLANVTIVNSEAVADALRTLTARHNLPLELAYNGIDPVPFDLTVNTQRRALRAAIGVPTDAWCVGQFSRLAHWKGQHVLLEAVAQLLLGEHGALQRRAFGGVGDRGNRSTERPTRLPEVHVVLVGAALFGEDAYEAELREWVARHGLQSRVHFVGFQHDIPGWMAAMDVIVHASVAPEPFGRVVVEGMLAGKPVIAARAGGVTEIIDDHMTGLLTPPGDAPALSRALENLRRDPEMARELALQGREVARSRFSETAYLDVVDTAIGRALESASGKASAVPEQV